MVIWANQQGALLLDRHLSEVIGHSFIECLSPEAAALAESRLAAIRAGGTVSPVVELKVCRPAGTERWLEANVTTIVRHEKVSGRLLIGRDISARKQAELDLVERNRLLEFGNMVHYQHTDTRVIDEGPRIDERTVTFDLDLRETSG